MAYRVVKFPIKLNQIADAESIRKFEAILAISTDFWNYLTPLFQSNYKFNNENNTFHFEMLQDKNGILKKTKIKHSDYKPDVGQSFAEKEAKNFFKNHQVHSHLQQEVAARFERATQKSFLDFKKNQGRFHPPKLKQSFEDYKSLKFKQKGVGYKLDFERNEVSFNTNANKIKFNFIGDNYHKNIIKNNEEKFIIIKKDKDIYTLCVYIEGEFEFVPNSNSLNLQYNKPKLQNPFSKRLLKRIAKLNPKEQAHIKQIQKIHNVKNKIISKKEKVENQNNLNFKHPERVLGLDPGCGYSNTLCGSNETIFNFADKHYANIVRLEYNKDKIKNKIPNSNSYLELQNLITKEEKHIANYRLDWLHKVAKQLAQLYDTIAFEDFNSKDFVEDNNITFLNKQVMNAAFGSLKTFIAYKAKMANKKFILIDPAYTTQICSNPDCNKSYINFNKKELKNRIHKCECGLCIDRDINSARNILLLATNEQFRIKFNSIVKVLKSQKTINNEPRNGLGDCKAIAENKTIIDSQIEQLKSSALTEAHGLKTLGSSLLNLYDIDNTGEL